MSTLDDTAGQILGLWLERDTPNYHANQVGAFFNIAQMAGNLELAPIDNANVALHLATHWTADDFHRDPDAVVADIVGRPEFEGWTSDIYGGSLTALLSYFYYDAFKMLDQFSYHDDRSTRIALHHRKAPLGLKHSWPTQAYEIASELLANQGSGSGSGS